MYYPLSRPTYAVRVGRGPLDPSGPPPKMRQAKVSEYNLMVKLEISTLSIWVQFPLFTLARRAPTRGWRGRSPAGSPPSPRWGMGGGGRSPPAGTPYGGDECGAAPPEAPWGAPVRHPPAAPPMGDGGAFFPPACGAPEGPGGFGPPEGQGLRGLRPP